MKVFRKAVGYPVLAVKRRQLKQFRLGLDRTKEVQLEAQKIEQFKQEIPYSAQVEVEAFKEEDFEDGGRLASHASGRLQGSKDFGKPDFQLQGPCHCIGNGSGHRHQDLEDGKLSVLRPQ